MTYALVLTAVELDHTVGVHLHAPHLKRTQGITQGVHRALSAPLDDSVGCACCGMTDVAYDYVLYLLSS